MSNNSAKPNWSEFEMISTKLNTEQNKYITSLDRHIERLQQMSEEERRKFSQKSLYESGVTTKSGKAKKKIVSWE